METETKLLVSTLNNIRLDQALILRNLATIMDMQGLVVTKTTGDATISNDLSQLADVSRTASDQILTRVKEMDANLFGNEISAGDLVSKNDPPQDTL